MPEELLRPSEAADRLGIAVNTLRVYSARFAALLSPAAGTPASPAGGRHGHRLYTSADLSALRRARDLVASGLTYEEALERIAPTPKSTEREKVDSATQDSGVDGDVAVLREAAAAWRSLAEERNREIVELRTRVHELEKELLALARVAASEGAHGSTTGSQSANRGSTGRGQPNSRWWSRIVANDPEE